MLCKVTQVHCEKKHTTVCVSDTKLFCNYKGKQTIRMNGIHFYFTSQVDVKLRLRYHGKQLYHLSDIINRVQYTHFD